MDGLGDDDHSGYFILAGRSGGQSAYGSTVTAETLSLAANSVDSIDNQILLNADGTVSLLNGAKIDPHIGTATQLIIDGGDTAGDDLILNSNSNETNGRIEILGNSSLKLYTRLTTHLIDLYPNSTQVGYFRQSPTTSQFKMMGRTTSGYEVDLLGGLITTGGTLRLGLDSDVVQAGNRFLTMQGGSSGTTERWGVTEIGSLIHAPAATGVMYDWQLETEWTTGSLMDADFGDATTLTGDIIAWEIDFETNVTLDGNNAFGFRINVGTGEVALDITKGTIDLNSQGSVINIGNTSSNLVADTWTLTGPTNQQVLNITAVGAAVDSTITLGSPASSTGSNELAFQQGSADGSANNMAYILKYDGNAGDFALETKDADGASADADVFVIADGTNDIKFSGGLSVDALAAPTQGIDADVIRLGVSGGNTGWLEIDGLTSGTVTIDVNDVAGTWTLELPAAAGGAGDQLTDAGGNGVTSWAAAGSLRKFKNILRKVNPSNALDAILNAIPYQFRYKKRSKRNTGDFDTVYSGVMGEDAPWAMHHKGEVFSPISAFGYTVAAFQALEERIKELESKLNI